MKKLTINALKQMCTSCRGVKIVRYGRMNEQGFSRSRMIPKPNNIVRRWQTGFDSETDTEYINVLQWNICDCCTVFSIALFSLRLFDRTDLIYSVFTCVDFHVTLILQMLLRKLSSENSWL